GGATTIAGASGAPPTGAATGTVLVNGAPFTSGTIPFGATVDVTRGTLALVTSTGRVKLNSSGGISAVFKLLRGVDKKKPIVELRLVKGDFSVCPKRKPSSVARAA